MKSNTAARVFSSNAAAKSFSKTAVSRWESRIVSWTAGMSSRSFMSVGSYFGRASEERISCAALPLKVISMACAAAGAAS